jgi:hypothetical protein
MKDKKIAFGYKYILIFQDEYNVVHGKVLCYNKEKVNELRKKYKNAGFKISVKKI